MLQLQASAVGDQVLSERLNEAANRVNAVGRAYERLAYTADYKKIDLIAYLREVIGDLETTVALATSSLMDLKSFSWRRIVRSL
jgi:two-component sensor histidine kinase